MKEHNMFELFEEMQDVAKAMSRDVKMLNAEINAKTAILYFADENGKEYFVKVGERGTE